MAGHSKWANIKRRKGAQDQARGKLFTKLIKEIHVAVKMGGPDLDANSRLRLAVDKAKSNSVPRNTIERAIAKASGDGDDANYENLTYEGYGPGGVAVLVQCLTDNRNRTASEVKHAFSKNGGNLGASGSVAYQFQEKGEFAVPKEAISEDDLFLAVADAEAEDIQGDDTHWIVTCARDAYLKVRTALEELELEIARSELTMIADNSTMVDTDDAQKIMKLLAALDELDDVQDTYTNADFDDETAAALG